MGSSNHLYFHGLAVSAAQRASSRPSPPLGPVEPQQNPQSDEFFDWLFERAGLAAQHYRHRSLVRRLPACLRRLGVRDVARARALIEAQPTLLQPALDSILLGVTEFCRDRSVFQMLRSSIVPALLNHFGSLRIWSAACSDGQELYSVAMLLHEAGALDRSYLLGTDCRREAIAQAAEGCFSRSAIEQVDLHWREKYFTPTGSSYRAAGFLHASLNWRVADLFQEVESGPWHLILWRNMAIYLKAEPANRIWRSLFEELHSGGYMITGRADHPPGFLALERVGACIYRKGGLQ